MKQKQHITTEQWNELDSFEQQKWVEKFIKTKDINFEKNYRNYLLEFHQLPNIGQMIEFLEDDHNFEIYYYRQNTDIDSWLRLSVMNKDYDCDKVEFCDALWKNVKSKFKND